MWFVQFYLQKSTYYENSWFKNERIVFDTINHLNYVQFIIVFLQAYNNFRLCGIGNNEVIQFQIMYNMH